MACIEQFIKLKKSKMKKKRQYRSNQGRDPKKNEQTYKLLELTVVIGIITMILYLISLQ